MKEMTFEERVKSNLDGLLTLCQDNKLILESILVHQILILAKLYNKDLSDVQHTVYQEVLRKVNLTGIPDMLFDLQKILTE
jgi:hypothetical protein